MRSFDIPFPARWPEQVKSSIHHVISLAHWSLINTRSWAANSPIQRVRLTAQRDQAITGLSQAQEIMRVKDARMSRISPHHRPNYLPIERQAILEIMAANGWSIAQTARIFMVEPDTIASWLRRLDDDVLIRTPTPMNKYPEIVRHIVNRLKILCPLMGKKRIAEILAACGLYLAATTVGRFIKTAPKKPDPLIASSNPSAAENTTRKTIIARYPNHVWNIDLTIVPTGKGFWTLWFPFALPQCYPFAYWVAAIIDHFSRAIMGIAVFHKQPTAHEIKLFLSRAISRVGKKPRHLITDKGSQFTAAEFRKYCERKKIKQRFGAVGKYGSIAVIERFIRSMKDECARRIMVPLRINEMRNELALYILWYNACRPHQSLRGLTPLQRYHGLAPPISALDVKKNKDMKLELHVSCLEGRKHLPIITLKAA